MAISGSTIRKLPVLKRGPQVVVALLVLGLLGAMLVEPTRQLLEQRQRLEGMERELTFIEESNEELRARIERLQDPDYIEQQAREQSGLVMPGETSYRVVPPSAQELQKKKEMRAAREPDPAAPEPGFFERFLDFVGFI